MRGAATSIARSPRGGATRLRADALPRREGEQERENRGPEEECGAAIRRLGAECPQARGRSHS